MRNMKGATLPPCSTPKFMSIVISFSKSFVLAVVRIHIMRSYVAFLNLGVHRGGTLRGRKRCFIFLTAIS